MVWYGKPATCRDLFLRPKEGKSYPYLYLPDKVSTAKADYYSSLRGSTPLSLPPFNHVVLSVGRNPSESRQRRNHQSIDLCLYNMSLFLSHYRDSKSQDNHQAEGSRRHFGRCRRLGKCGSHADAVSQL